MHVRVLGALHVEQDGVDITPSAHKPRQILSLLALNSNRVVPNAGLMEELWDDNPPRSAVTTLQTYIMQLRKSMAGAMEVPTSVVVKENLITTPGGYLLRLPPESIDLHRYETLDARGRDALDADDGAEAVRLFDEALRLWHGTALVDVPPGPLLQREIVRMEEARFGTIEKRIEANLRLNRHSEMLGELRALCMEHQLHESLQAQYMICLHHCGRRDEALAAFRTLRWSLIKELGLEPSVKLQRLHRAILADDPILHRTPSFFRLPPAHAGTPERAKTPTPVSVNATEKEGGERARGKPSRRRKAQHRRRRG
ncbi:AfsR/SARP family transcriptional regulator [Nonomuraea sp. NPDC005650]|uniref:AfsR/SARP family transcriptional regulator n=1 Tax=Nonomuraea sp. NPDC005650 TaxID=3157045 RepID=UPI0033B8637D